MAETLLAIIEPSGIAERKVLHDFGERYIRDLNGRLRREDELVPF